MVVLGQPKTAAEYIQATSRVGRDRNRPGLVVTLLNLHRARDRSHYERFATFHQTFYRSVEVTSVTPFSPRALDRGLAGALVALTRLGHVPLTPARGAGEILAERGRIDFVLDCLAERARNHAEMSPPEAESLGRRVRELAADLLDDWSRIADDYRNKGVQLQYGTEFANRFKSQEWPGRRLPEVFYDPRALDITEAKRASLHAKCVVVDGRRAFVSSANFTEAAHIARRLSNHFDALVEAGLLKRIPGL